MAHAYVDEYALELLQIQVDPRKIVCSGCGQALIEAHFYGRVGGKPGQHRNRLWVPTRRCSYCRWKAKQYPSRVVSAAEAERERARQAVRDRTQLDLTSYRDDRGQRRCMICQSTVYRQIIMVDQQHESNVYIVEWTCWAAGHVLFERWVRGSPVKGSFPIARDTAERQHIPLGAMMVYRPEAVAKTVQRPLPMYSMRLINKDIALQEGCDERCVLVQYRDVDRPAEGIYMRRAHDPAAHNEHQLERTLNTDTLTYHGMEINFPAHEVIVDGVNVNDASKPLTLTEWKMLRTLARGFGRTIEHAEMLRFVWGDDFLEEIHLLRVNMTRLRAKLEPNDAQRFITTIPCIGYQLGTPADRRALEQEQGLASP